MDLPNRNDLCWCGSGKKYKKCHLAFDEKLDYLAHQGVHVPDHDMIKTPAQIAAIKESCQLNTAVLDHVAAHITVGMSTEEINRLVHEKTLELGGIPAPLDFEGFPKSTCTSLNDEVCHGIPSEEIILKSGDIVNVDVSTIYGGYFSDASRMFMLGEVSSERQKLVEATKECLNLGIAAAKPWGYTGDIGEAIQTYAQSLGYSVVKELGGHGVGLAFHEEPFICHLGRRGTGTLLVPGMIFTIEPMINAGTAKVQVSQTNGWTVTTKDGKDSAQWEHTILITEEGPEILTY